MEIINQIDFLKSVYSIQIQTSLKGVNISSGDQNDVLRILKLNINEASKLTSDLITHTFEQIVSKVKGKEQLKIKEKGLLIKNLSIEFINSIKLIYPEDGRNFKIHFIVSPNLSKWRLSYSFDDYYLTLVKIINESVNDNSLIKPFREKNEGFSIGFFTDLNEYNLLHLIHHYSVKLNKIHCEITELLLKQNEKESISKYFEFPAEVKIFCEQYLLYFAQFLKDSGINAISDLKEDAGKVLFSVTPTDGIEALDKIREALAVYLNLPSSPIVYDESFAAMRLQQQIENLQHSQKMAAREMQLTEKLVIAQSEMIQEKNTIISQKDSVIQQQNKVIEKITSKSIMIDSLENKEELEEIYDGLKIGESKFLKEKLGIHLNPAKVIKTGVNNLFGKGEEIISILDSDEEAEKNS